MSVTQGVKPYYQDDNVVIYHGDCRELIGALEFDVVVTDPPYGMGFGSGRGGHQGDCAVINDEDVTARDVALELTSGRPALVFGRWSCQRPGGTRALLTWEKGEHVGMGDLALPWKPNTEEIYVIGSGFTSDRRGSSVLRYLAVAGTVRTADAGRNHPTEKPVDLMRDLIGKCPPGVILDPFMGSGSTLRAAKDLGRKAIGIEIDERYCEIAAKRMGQEVLF
jgi:site-specific DNA-methyltransferase (adenine-specific)